jgi:hypothetical protein
LKEAQIGEDPDEAVIWQTVLHQTFPLIRKWYLNSINQDRKRFDCDDTSAFFTHAATHPRMNAEKLIALLNAGLVNFVRLGKNCRF